MGILDFLWMLVKLYATVLLAATGMAAAVVVFNLSASAWRKLTHPQRRYGNPLPTRETSAIP